MAWPTSTFPTALDEITDIVDNVSEAKADDINGAYDAIEKLEAKVGVDSSAVATSLDYRVGVLESFHGAQRRAKFGYTDADTITIGPGMYNHAGTVTQTVYWDSTLTKDVVVSGTQFYYLYIDDSAIVSAGTNVLTATEFTISTTSPTWSDAKRGWYNGDDRCIFAFRVVSGSVASFYHDGGESIQYGTSKTDLTNTGLAAKREVTLTIPAFSTKASVYIRHQLALSGLIYASPVDAAGITIGSGLSGEAVGACYSLITSSTQNIYIYLDSYDGTNMVFVTTNGWFFPVGM